MAYFTKISAVLLVLALISVPALEAKELKAAHFGVANCSSYRTVDGGRRVCARCTTGYLLVPGDGGCARQSTIAAQLERPGMAGPVAQRKLLGGVYRQTTAVGGRPAGGVYRQTTAVGGRPAGGVYHQTTAVGGRGAGGVYRQTTAARGRVGR